MDLVRKFSEAETFEELKQMLDEHFFSQPGRLGASGCMYEHALFAREVNCVAGINIGALVRSEDGGRVTLADSASGAVATDIVVDTLADDRVVVSPMAEISMFFTDPGAAGYRPVFLGTNGEVVTKENVGYSGTIQKCGINLDYAGEGPDVYRVRFFIEPQLAVGA
jgi:hypothetical protein